MALTDSANVTITGSTTSNNAWGGLALYQTNTYYDQQVNNIVVDGTNSFNDTIPVYTEDQSASQNFGSISLAGFSYVVQSPNNANDVYSWFQKTEQAAFDFATNAALSNNNVNVPTATVQGYSGSGAYGNNVFYVGTGSNAVAMSIGNAITQAASGGTVNVNTGTYAEDVTDATQLTFNFGDVTVNSFTLASGAAGSALNGDLTATGAIALNGAATVTGDLTAASFTSNATLALTGDLDASGAAALNGASSITGNLAADSLVTGNTLALTGNIAATNGVTLGGASTITGNVNAKTFTANGTLALNGNLAATGAALFNGASTVNGNVNAASITATDAFALNGNAAASGAIALNGATTLAGNLTGGSIALGATTLTGNTSLDTSAANGAIKVASVNGATAGGQSLAIKAGTGSVSLGNAGATTRLGAVSDASKTTLTGSTYNANSFLFGGDVTLTSADTTLNTTQSAGAAGDITFQGDLFGTTDGSQSLTLIAGPGTGAASANGDILLQNAGTTAVNLNNLTVSGDDFTALTVDLAGNYNSLLTGNQVFAADTLNVKGNANSIVGGDASGHIVASGDVTIAAGGDVSGTISGENVNLTGDDVNSVVTANNAANIKGNTVEGSYTADTVTLIASNNVDAAVDATDFVLAANHGSVDGTWTTINTDGSNVVSVNGQTTVGMANVNPNQLVVEGFVLPAGTTIGANGQLILPEGTLLGLLSPGGGKPKMILVHTVHQLGELLASGYSVIVIDLSGHGKEKLVQLAAN
jgi:cytoskeletal protein CcmA (bactofilin family)